MENLSNDKVIHVIKDGIQYIQFRKLLEYEDKLKHCFTMKDLNFRHKSIDDDDYKAICTELNINNNNIVHPKQTHTNRVEVVEKNSTSKDFYEVDGLIIEQKEKVLSFIIE